MPLTLRDAQSAFARYEQLRDRLPQAVFRGQPRLMANLTRAAEFYDGFLLDAFGVLNVGQTPIPGAIDRMAELRAMGKKLCVLTNAASFDNTAIKAKFNRLGFDFAADEILSSRAVAVAELETVAPGATWAAITAEHDLLLDMPVPVTDVFTTPAALDDADAILFLSSTRWNTAWQNRLIAALQHRPRPVVIANPDLTAPNETGFSREPGLYGHDIADKTTAKLHWFGKPFGRAFSAAIARTGLNPGQLAMVGDTLHTDVLGGRAAGCGTVLVTDHGLFRGQDAGQFIAACGICPDVIVPTT